MDDHTCTDTHEEFRVTRDLRSSTSTKAQDSAMPVVFEAAALKSPGVPSVPIVGMSTKVEDIITPEISEAAEPNSLVVPSVLLVESQKNTM